MLWITFSSWNIGTVVAFATSLDSNIPTGPKTYFQKNCFTGKRFYLEQFAIASYMIDQLNMQVC